MKPKALFWFGMGLMFAMWSSTNQKPVGVAIDIVGAAFCFALATRCQGESK